MSFHIHPSLDGTGPIGPRGPQGIQGIAGPRLVHQEIQVQAGNTGSKRN